LTITLKETYAAINKTINSVSFKQKHRLSKSDFTRKRNLDFPSLVMYLINFRKHSAQTELDQFFKYLKNKSLASQEITKSAFFQARKKLSHLAFKDLNKQLISSIYNDKRQSKTWKGFRLCAIDGTTLRLPNSTNIIKTFGMHKSAKEKADCPMALGSISYDVLNKMVIDSSNDPIGFSERKAAQNHLQFATKNDLVQFDRGYKRIPYDGVLRE